MGNDLVMGREHHLRDRRAVAQARLVAAGHKRYLVEHAEGLVYAIEVELGRDRDCSVDEFVAQYLGYGRNSVATPRQPLLFREYKPPRHPRESDIGRTQPRMISMGGVGNGAERHHGYGRG